MAIVKMKKIRLLALRSERDELLKELMLLGCVEISEPAAALADEEIASVFRRSAGPTAQVKGEAGRQSACSISTPPSKNPCSLPAPRWKKATF